MMNANISRSYRLCNRVARKKAGNFYYAFVLLPKEKRDAICAIYAFMRHSDDLVDETFPNDPAAKKARLDLWRRDIEMALREEKMSHPVFPALIDAMRRFSIPEKYLFDLLDGVGMDIDKNRYETFDDLYQYCYRVASVVGLVCLHIFGFTDKKALEYAERAGIAFQLTNILRDIRIDRSWNRIYIPLEDLKKFRYTEKNLTEEVVDDHFRRLIHFEIERARDYYEQSECLPDLVSPESRRAMSALMGIYRGLLEKIRKQQESVFRRKIRLSLLEKLSIVYRAWRNPSHVEAVA